MRLNATLNHSRDRRPMPPDTVKLHKDSTYSDASKSNNRVTFAGQRAIDAAPILQV
jgi:hypothetical protein